MGVRILKSGRGNEGFTIVELLVSILVSMIVLAAVSAAFIVQDKSFAKQEQVIDAHENARAAIQLMMKELLMAGYDPTGGASAGILLADSNTVRFTMDTNNSGNGDGDVADSNEDITYALDTAENQITRKVGSSGTPQPIAENIEALAFSYFDRNGNQLTGVPLSNSDKAKVTRISVEVTPKMPETAGFNRRDDPENLIQLARAGAVRVWVLVNKALTPNAHAASDKTLKDSVTPPNLGKTKTGANDDYDAAEDKTYIEISSSSSSSS